MSAQTGKVEALLESAQDRLQADPQFADVLIIADHAPYYDTDGSLVTVENELAAGVNEFGIAIKIGYLRAGIEYPNVMTPMSEFDIVVEILMNQVACVESGMTPEAWCEAVVALLHLWTPLESGTAATPRNPAWATREVGGLVIAALTIRCGVSIASNLLKVAAPVADLLDDNTVVLTSETAGAAIYYTTDGSNPKPTSTLYTGPFTPSAGEMRSRAYAAGKRSSDITRVIFG